MGMKYVGMGVDGYEPRNPCTHNCYNSQTNSVKSLQSILHSNTILMTMLTSLQEFCRPALDNTELSSLSEQRETCQQDQQTPHALRSRSHGNDGGHHP